MSQGADLSIMDQLWNNASVKKSLENCTSEQQKAEKMQRLSKLYTKKRSEMIASPIGANGSRKECTSQEVGDGDRQVGASVSQGNAEIGRSAGFNATQRSTSVN